jgi:hypothetical protein
VPTILEPSWFSKWVRLPFVVEHLEVLPLVVTCKVKEELENLDEKNIVTIEQLL